MQSRAATPASYLDLLKTTRFAHFYISVLLIFGIVLGIIMVATTETRNTPLYIIFTVGFAFVSAYIYSQTRVSMPDVWSVTQRDVEMGGSAVPRGDVASAQIKVKRQFWERALIVNAHVASIYSGIVFGIFISGY